MIKEKCRQHLQTNSQNEETTTIRTEKLEEQNVGIVIE